MNTDTNHPVDGEVIAVRGSPGPASGISIDVVCRGAVGDEFFNNVRPIHLPDDFDIIIRTGQGVTISWRGEEARFSTPWLPVTTECGMLVT